MSICRTGMREWALVSYGFERNSENNAAVPIDLSMEEKVFRNVAEKINRFYEDYHLVHLCGM